MSDIKEWSIIGQQLYSDGKRPYCLKCKFALKGERVCPNCGIKIAYPGENPDGSISKSTQRAAKAQDRANKLEKTGEALNSFGNGIMGCGCSVIFLFILWIIFKSFI